MGGKERTRVIAVMTFLQNSSKIPRCVSPVMESLHVSDGPPEAAVPISQSFSQQRTGAAACATATAGAMNGLV